MIRAHVCLSDMQCWDKNMFLARILLQVRLIEITLNIRFMDLGYIYIYITNIVQSQEKSMYSDKKYAHVTTLLIICFK